MNPYLEFDRLPVPPPAEESEVSSKWKEASEYIPSTATKQALELALALQQPLLITGEPGCGKTSAAYWAAWRLGLPYAKLFHVQVRSDSNASRLKYDFDVVSYFRESVIDAIQRPNGTESGGKIDGRNRNSPGYRRSFIDRGAIWRAFEASEKGRVVLLFDEIDKAPRDFPNDLLKELDAFEFEVPELEDRGQGVSVAPKETNESSGGQDAAIAESVPKTVVRATRGNLLCVITSNAERELPGAFLRRCLHHHLVLTRETMREAALARMQHWGLKLSKELLDLALDRYLQLAEMDLKHRPSFSEMLIWLQALGTGGADAENLRTPEPAKLKYLAALLKDPEDLARIRGTGSDDSNDGRSRGLTS